MQSLSRRIAARDDHRRPAVDAFYVDVVRFAEEAKDRRLHRQASGSRDDAARKAALFKKAASWWDQTVWPEFVRAQHALHDKAIVLSEVQGSSKDNPAAGYLERMITFRANRLSYAYRVSVQDCQISLRRMKGAKAVAMDGFYASVAVEKSSPSHVRLMITEMIKDCLA